jgi:hypothetical protein
MRAALPWLCVSVLVGSCVSRTGVGAGETASSVLVNRVGILGAGSCQYLTVSAAIAAAAANATILVEQGQPFNEQLGTISKNLMIRSGVPGCTAVSAPNAPKARIDAGHAGRLAKITADVTFQQITLMDGAVTDPLVSGPGGNLWISSGVTRLIDATVSGAQVNQAANDLNVYGGGIHLSAGAWLWVEGASDIIGNRNDGWGPGGLLVEAGASAVIQDESQIGIPALGTNTATQGPGGVLAIGTVTLKDEAEIAGNVGSAGGGLEVFGGTAWLLDEARVRDNLAPRGGGIFVAGGALYTENSVEIINNRATSSNGGGIDLQEGVVSLQGALVAGNEAQGCGGGIYAGNLFASNELVLLWATVDDNEAGTCGGGIANLRATLDVTDSTISNNRAGTDGGGLFLSGAESSADLDITFVNDNTAVRGAGIVAIDGTSLSTIDSNIDDNVASIEGGGVWIGGAATEWGDGSSAITDNTAGRGGGFFAPGGAVYLDHSRLDRNHALSEGGGARVAGAAVEMRFGFVTGNTAGTKGGGFAVPGGRLVLLGTDVATNTAVTDGGGAVVESTGRIEATDVWFRDNAANARGGGIAVLSFAAATDPQLVLIGARNQEGCIWRGPIATNEYCSEIRCNSAVTGGGGIYLEDGTAFITGTTLRLNTAPVNGSALWMRSVATGTPAVAASNTLIIKNGNVVNVDAVRVMGGSFVGEHVTSADNLGAPFRFGAAAGPSLLQRSIVWDTDNVVVSSATPLGATCTMFRAVTGATVGPNIAFGLDPVFATTGRGKYRLGALSVDAVDQCDIGLPFDLDTDPRPVNALYDRGAFERQ